MKILYITNNFESLTHTFITREVHEVRQAGNDVRLLALRQIASERKAAHPECDLSGCRYAYDVGFSNVLLSTMRCVVTRPRRLWRALRTATSESTDPLVTKLKLVYQLMVTTTLIDWVENGGFDHIHAHFADAPSSFAMYLHYLTGVPYSFTGHGADLFRDTSALRPKIANANGVVCISEFHRRFCRKLVPELSQTTIVHCGIDLDKFVRRHQTNPLPPLVILAVGRCVPKKGFADFLSALAKLDELNIEWEGRLAGDGPLLAELKRSASDLGIADRLVFLGSVQQGDIRQLLATASVFVLPSVPAADGDMDGIPVSLMEAMAVGCPVISTCVSGIPELIKHEISGLLVQPYDPDGLALAIRRLGQDPELYQTVAAGGRKEVENHFNLAQVGEQLTVFFKRISDRSVSER